MNNYNQLSFDSEFTAEETSHMTKKSISAFIKLKKLGCPIDVWYQNKVGYEDYRGFFWIKAEDEDAEQWLDYWNVMEGHERLNKILSDYGLYFEWNNSAVACVYEM